MKQGCTCHTQNLSVQSVPMNFLEGPWGWATPVVEGPVQITAEQRKKRAIAASNQWERTHNAPKAPSGN